MSKYRIKEIKNRQELQEINVDLCIMLRDYIVRSRSTMSYVSLFKKILDDIDSNTFGLFFCEQEIDGEMKPCAFMALNLSSPDLITMICNQSAVYIKPGVDYKIWDVGECLAIEWALDRECTQMVIQSNRNPMVYYQKRLKKRGYKPVSVIFSKELRKEDYEHEKVILPEPVLQTG